MNKFWTAWNFDEPFFVVVKYFESVISALDGSPATETSRYPANYLNFAETKCQLITTGVVAHWRHERVENVKRDTTLSFRRYSPSSIYSPSLASEKRGRELIRLPISDMGRVSLVSLFSSILTPGASVHHTRAFSAQRMSQSDREKWFETRARFDGEAKERERE